MLTIHYVTDPFTGMRPMRNPAFGYGAIGLAAAFVLGQGLHWFIGGEAAGHSFPRNALVVVQILFAAAALTWAQLRIWRVTGSLVGKG